MGYSRKIAPEISPESDALTSAMVGIGMNFAAPRIADPNIEDTLLFSSIEGMDHHDLRVLAVLVTWFGIHAPWVNADRLTKIVATQTSSRVRALWSVLGRWQSRGTIVDRRFARLAKVYTGTQRTPRPTRDQTASPSNHPGQQGRILYPLQLFIFQKSPLQ